jgi:hypothetical protein
VAESQFHHFILSTMGVAGIIWFYAIPHARHVWSQSRRSFVGIGSGLIYVTQALSAFTSLSNASSLELFGFIGCVLGCLGAARTMTDGATLPSSKPWEPKRDVQRGPGTAGD